MTRSESQQDDGTMDVTVTHVTSSSGDPNLTLLDYHGLQSPPMDRLFCGGCCHFDREAWETVKTLLSTIEELRFAASAVCSFPSPKAWERLEEVLAQCSPKTK
jgi:hypothetical protein